MDIKNIYYLSGRNESPANNILSELYKSEYKVFDRLLETKFLRLSFQKQIDVIKNDLSFFFAHPSSTLIARSYGGYLLLHSLIELGVFSGRILLFSPVLGPAFVKTEKGFFSNIPPFVKKLERVIMSGKFPKFRYMEIHTGKADQGCSPELAMQFSSVMTNTYLYLINDAGHDLGKVYYQKVLNRFLDVCT